MDPACGREVFSLATTSDQTAKHKKKQNQKRNVHFTHLPNYIPKLLPSSPIPSQLSLKNQKTGAFATDASLHIARSSHLDPAHIAAPGWGHLPHRASLQLNRAMRPSLFKNYPLPASTYIASVLPAKIHPKQPSTTSLCAACVRILPDPPAFLPFPAT